MRGEPFGRVRKTFVMIGKGGDGIALETNVMMMTLGIFYSMCTTKDETATSVRVVFIFYLKFLIESEMF